MTMTLAQTVAWIERTAMVMEENKAFLTDLDRAIGDADHGTNLARGFGKVLEKLPPVVDKDIGTVLKTVGMTLTSTVGGASGPLYGTFFLRAGMAAANKTELTRAELLTVLQKGVDGLVQRGRAARGDKTMLDVWLPVLDTLTAAADDLDLGAFVAKGVDVAAQGVQDTIPMQARKGRASYLGERSIGHQDPGATSSHLLLQALHDSLT